MNYEALRHFADSWGLVGMTASLIGLIGWTFRKGAKQAHQEAATMIFKEDDHG